MSYKTCNHSATANSIHSRDFFHDYLFSLSRDNIISFLGFLISLTVFFASHWERLTCPVLYTPASLSVVIK
jgi:hypothetical protein